MNASVELGLRAVLLGTGATLTMDLWGLVLKRFGVPSLNLALLGRWVGHLLRGRWRHVSIAAAAPVNGEAWIGWSAHYAIGIAFSALLLGMFGVEWARSPSLTPALLVGIVTVVAPWFILQPGMGAGIASRKTPAPLFNALKSLVTHTVFGLGLYLTARLAASVLPGWR
ncbi:MAG: DUF2938 domain-containing protein [Vicinamibacterales bacterium]